MQPSSWNQCLQQQEYFFDSCLSGVLDTTCDCSFLTRHRHLEGITHSSDIAAIFCQLSGIRFFSALEVSLSSVFKFSLLFSHVMPSGLDSAHSSAFLASSTELKHSKMGIDAQCIISLSAWWWFVNKMRETLTTASRRHDSTHHHHQSHFLFRTPPSISPALCRQGALVVVDASVGGVGCLKRIRRDLCAAWTI